MELSIAPIANKLDVILHKMGNTGEEKKLRKGDMEKMFDNILKGDDGKRDIV